MIVNFYKPLKLFLEAYLGRGCYGGQLTPPPRKSVKSMVFKGGGGQTCAETPPPSKNSLICLWVFLTPIICLGIVEPNNERVPNKNPLLMIEEEQKEQSAKLSKMEREMEEVFGNCFKETFSRHLIK